MIPTSPSPAALGRQLFVSYERFRLAHLSPANCKHRVIERECARLVDESGGLLTCTIVGRSTEGRSINLISCGSGRKTVLLWSQMHGDESTATLALLDILQMLNRRSNRDPWVKRLLAETTLLILPMLNPDGAQRVQRYTALGVDMNRDALALGTPEARILRNLQRRYRPSFGFNLHDQGPSRVGVANGVAAIALLAPAPDRKNSITPARRRAIHIAAVIAQTLNRFAAGHLSRYDDTFEPRAFGDNMQRWGTSTVLIESGQRAGDPQKAFIRKLNFVGITCALWSIATDQYLRQRRESYTQLELNGKGAFDILVRDIVLEHPNGSHCRADIGLSKSRRWRSGSLHEEVTVKEIGDLRNCDGLTTIRGNCRRLPAMKIQIEQTLPLKRLLSFLRPPRA